MDKTSHALTTNRRREVGFVLILVGAAAFAFGWLGFSLVAFLLIACGGLALLVGLALLRPTGRTLVAVMVTIAFVTMPVWLWLIVVSVR